jgi:protein-S-isoprenylcysteine O-methyltransferase Ste14
LETDNLFHLILTVGFGVMAPVGFYFRLKSHTQEPLDRRQEGLFILISLRLVGLAGVAGLIAYIIAPSSMSWSALPLPDWLRWLGVVLGIGAGLMLIWTLRTLGKNLTDTVVTRKDHFLVTGGPYRFVRHPFYCSSFLAIAANTLVAANWFFLAGGLVFCVLIVIRTKKEEEFLLSRFGHEYQRYMNQTGKFWPVRALTAGGNRKHT